MNSVRVPGFSADRSLILTISQSGAIVPPNVASDSDDNLNGSGSITLAEGSEPGGPGNVPSGYGRDCQRVPIQVCAGKSCYTDYAWVCTYYPLARAMSGLTLPQPTSTLRAW
jgi:hypothetical protein